MPTARLLLPPLLLLVALSTAHAQGSAGHSSRVEPRWLVTVPTAGMLRGGTFALDASIFREGGVQLAVSVGIWDRLGIGVSYGGRGVIGTGSAAMNPVPGFSVRLRPVDESLTLPAIILGFDSQGSNGYLTDRDRYTIKSPGLFATISKNYALLGYLSLHGGANYSFERADGDRDLNYYAGVEKTIGPTISLLLEYNLATNDDGQNALGKGTGYLSAGLRWSIGEGITLGFDLEDLTRNSSVIDGPTRTVRLEYVTPL